MLGLVLTNSHSVNGYVDLSIKWHLSLIYVPIRPIKSITENLIIPCN